MFNGLFNFLIIDNFSAFVTFVVGLFAFALYYLDKREKIVTGSELIITDIRKIENKVSDLKKHQDLLKTQLDSISSDSWNTYQHIISKHLNEDERREISIFFDNILALQKAIKGWKEIHADSLITKTTQMQKKIIDIADNSQGDKNKYENRKNFLTSIIHPEDYWFEPSVFKQQINEMLSQFNTILTSSTGQNLTKLSKGKFLLP